MKDANLVTKIICEECNIQTTFYMKVAVCEDLEEPYLEKWLCHYCVERHRRKQ